MASSSSPASPPEEAALPCPNWIFSINSDIHVAKDRSWFGNDYLPFKSAYLDVISRSEEVVGIGAVNLPVKVSPTKSGPNSHGILRLEHVLHAPGALCNILGAPLAEDFNVTMADGPLKAGLITEISTGRSVAYLKPNPGVYCEVRLSGPPTGPAVGPSVIDPAARYCIEAHWPVSERERYNGAVEYFSANLEQLVGIALTNPTALTPSETAWVRCFVAREVAELTS